MKRVTSVLTALSFVLTGTFGTPLSQVAGHHGLSNEIWGNTITNVNLSNGNVTVYVCASASSLPADCGSSKFFLMASTNGAKWYLGNPQNGWYYRFWAEAPDGSLSNKIDVTYQGTTVNAGDLVMPTGSVSSTSLAAPTLSMTPSSPNPSAHTLSWNGVTGATSFKLSRRLSGGSWAEILNGYPNTTYIDGNLTAGTYDYHVNACNVTGCSPDSNIVSGSIGTASPSPAPIPTSAAVPSAVTWVRQFGTSANTNAWGVTADSSGNVFVVGDTDAAFDGQPLAGLQDAFIVKYDPNGNKLWTRTLGGSNGDGFRGAAVDSSGEIYAVGYTYSALEGQSRIGEVDALIVKYDTNGNKLWVRIAGTSSNDEYFRTAVLSGEIYVAGRSEGAFGGQASAGKGDALLAKYDANGTLVWSRLIGSGDYDEARSVAVDSSGNAYLAGWTRGSLSGQPYAGSEDAFLAKYSPSGTLLWTRLVGGSTSDAARGVTVDGVNNAFMLATTGGSLEGFSSAGSYDSVVVKYDPNGTKLWARQFGSARRDFSYDIAAGAQNAVFVAGDTGGALNQQSNAGSSDAFLLKYDTNGTLVWTRLLGGSNNDIGYAVVVGSSETIYLSGVTTASAFVARYNQSDGSGPTDFAGAGVSPISAPTPYPTPIPLPTGDATVTGKVTDTSGVAVANASVSVRTADYTLNYGTAADSQGLYTISRIPAGSYKLEVFPPYGSSGLVSPPAVDIILGSGQTLTKDLVLDKATKTLKGKVARPDGKAVTNATINAWNKGISTLVETRTDAAGGYTLLLSGGTWEVSVYSTTTPADWVYNQPSRSVTFLSDTTPEEKTLNFTVTVTDSTIKGKILKPDGTVLPQGAASINFQKSEGGGFGGSTDATGAFQVSVSAGTYSVFIYVSDPLYNAPVLPVVTIASGEIKDLGTITLVKATKTIKGTVKRPDGKAISDATINAFRKDGGTSVQARTDATGAYTLSVIGGSWEVSIFAQNYPADWSYNQSPQFVTFLADSTAETKTLDFTVTLTDATVKGKVVRSDGTSPTINSVFINFQKEGGLGFSAPVDAAGIFTAKLAAGTYNIFIDVKDSGFSAPSVTGFTIQSAETKDLGTITLVKSTKTIKGKIKTADGKAVTDAIVNAWRRDTGSSANIQTDATGAYTLLVTGGYWDVSVSPRNYPVIWSYNQSPQSVVFADNAAAEEKILDFTVTVSDAVVKGKVLKPDGTAPSPNTVFVNFQAEEFGFGAPVDGAGGFSINVAKGAYSVFVQVNDPLYNAPAVPAFTILSAETKDLGTITLVKATKTVKGKITRSDGKTVSDALVNAVKIAAATTGYAVGTQPPPSGFASAQTDANGNYTLLVTGGSWELNIYPISKTATDWLYNKPPQVVTFAENTTPEEKTLNFTVTTADATVKGKVVKPDGKAPAPHTVFVDIRSREGFGAGTPLDTNGAFSVAVPAGAYQVHIWSQDQALVPPSVPEVMLAKGETKDLGTLTLVAATKIIKGKITREDGRPVTDAEVGGTRKDTQSWVGTKPDSSGNYSLLVAGGSWELNIYPVSIAPDWSYAKPPISVVFSADSAPEEKTVNFAVVSSDAVVIGKVLKPDGTAPSPNTVFVGLDSSTGFGAGGPIDSSGAFRIAVAAGTYNVFIHSQDQTLSTPRIDPVTVAKDETKNLGTLKLIARNDRITGKVVDKNGQALSGIWVEAFQPQGSGFATAKTDTLGVYTLFVTAGEWDLAARPDPALNLYNPDPAKRVTITSGVAATVNFTLLPADAAISGVMIDSQGNTVNDVFGWAELHTQAPTPQPAGEIGNFTPGFGASIERGSFTIKAPAGLYTLSIYLPPDSSYTAGQPQTVTATTSGVTNVKVVIFKNTSVITGALKDETGKPVAGLDARVFAATRAGAWQEATVDRLTGAYKLRVAPGAWLLRFEIAPGSGYSSFRGPEVVVNVKEGEIVTKDLTVRKADATVSGKVIDPAGKAIARAFLGVSKTSFRSIFEGTEFKDPIVAGTETDDLGNYKVAVPAGEYFVKVFLRPELGFINPEEQRVILATSTALVLNLVVRSADLKISGTVFADDRAAAEAFVWAWSEKGGYQESFSRSDGSYQLNVTSSDVWRVVAGKEINGDFYRADEAAVVVATSSVTHSITLKKFLDLPPPATKTQSAAQSAVVSVENGATVVVPANAVATAGSVTINVTPDVRAPSQGEMKVVGVAFDIEARTATSTISTLNAKVTITIPYNDADLVKLGIEEKNLTISFWDPTVGTWKPIENAIVNTETNVVTCLVDHFTRFAIVAAADVTPPQPPLNIAGAALGGGKIKLTWKDPTKDFRYAKVYRSTEGGELGTVIAPEAVGGELVDNDIVDGALYSYTVRAVDPAGNESKNIDQIAIKAIGTSVKGAAPKVEVKKEAAPVATAPAPAGTLKKTITRLLRQGHKGEDVKVLQEFLTREGFYRAKVTSYFGPATRAALKRFQEKYKTEILTPRKRRTGTGALDEQTLKKINELLGGPGSTVPAKQTNYEIQRTLTLGSAGDEVKMLQWLLDREGLYPESIVNGVFSEATRQAVKRFQQKYAAQILAAIGLTRGSGIVGAETRKKLNELFSLFSR